MKKLLLLLAFVPVIAAGQVLSYHRADHMGGYDDMFEGDVESISYTYCTATLDNVYEYATSYFDAAGNLTRHVQIIDLIDSYIKIVTNYKNGICIDKMEYESFEPDDNYTLTSKKEIDHVTGNSVVYNTVTDGLAFIETWNFKERCYEVFIDGSFDRRVWFNKRGQQGKIEYSTPDWPTVVYTYSPGGDIIQKDSEQYFYTDIDQNGNWTLCIINDASIGNTFFITREFNYRDGTQAAVSSPIEFSDAEVHPTFNGDDGAQFAKWVAANLKYPEIARENGISGRVVVRFIIEPDGSVSSVESLRSPDKHLEKEAIRVVSSSPAWSPAIVGGKPVRCYFTMPVIFKL